MCNVQCAMWTAPVTLRTPYIVHPPTPPRPPPPPNHTDSGPPSFILPKLRPGPASLGGVVGGGMACFRSFHSTTKMIASCGPVQYMYSTCTVHAQTCSLPYCAKVTTYSYSVQSNKPRVNPMPVKCSYQSSQPPTLPARRSFGGAEKSGKCIMMWYDHRSTQEELLQVKTHCKILGPQLSAIRRDALDPSSRFQISSIQSASPKRPR